MLDKVHFAVEGMLESEVAKKAVALEKLYQQTNRLLFWKRLKIARAMVRELALAYAQLQNSQNAQEMQAAQYAEFMRVNGEPANLARFLRAEFPNAFVEMTGKMKFPDMAMEILERLKAGQRVS